MTSNRKIVIFIVGFILTGIIISLAFPKETKKNPNAMIRVGAGDDMSGILMEETVKELNGKYTISETMESSQFQDC